MERRVQFGLDADDEDGRDAMEKSYDTHNYNDIPRIESGVLMSRWC